MINNEDSNIVFTPEQTQAIEEAKARLLNLESEISIAIKNLKNIRNESERAIKDKAYQEDLLAELTPRLEERKNQIQKCDEDIKNANSVLVKLQEEIKTKTAEQSEKDAEFQTREAEIIRKEQVNTTRERGLNFGVNRHLNEQEDFNQKVAKLKEVISAF